MTALAAPRMRIRLALALIALVLLIGLAKTAGLFAPADMAAMHLMARLHAWPGADLATQASLGLAALGKGSARLYIALVAGLFLAFAGRPRAMLWLLGAVLLMMIVNQLLKTGFAIPRPDLPEALAMAAGHSYPSGHAMGAMTLWGAIALVGRMRWLTAVCALMILATGLSRVWLGVHWPSDVAGGWLEGAAGLLLLSLILPARTEG